jgi:CPA2 family monovalent cation:H+ antiporter-2
MHTGNLSEVLVLLLFAVGIVAIFKKLKLSPVLGYLVAGGIIGPFGYQFITDVDTINYIGEFGVVLLMFVIGLELSFERLKEMRKQVFGFGTLQVALTASLIWGFAYFITGDQKASLVVGLCMALSSTAVVLQLLEERGESVTQYGRLSLANLILQDLAFVPLLIMIPLLAAEEAQILTAIFDATWKAAIALIVIFVVGKFLLRPVYKWMAETDSDELFIATTFLIVLGAAWSTDQMGLSLALGAFIAGLLVAETEYRTQVETDLRPFQGLLMGLFFMTIGMKIDFFLLLDKLGLIVFLTITLVIIKSLIIIFLARAFGFGKSCSIKAGLMLSQASEFSFVLFALAADSSIFSKEFSQVLIIVVAVSMAITPILAILAEKLSRRIEYKNPVHLSQKDFERETSDLDGHIIVIGFGRAGRLTGQLLASRDINFIAIDEDPKNVHIGRKEGFPVFYGKPYLYDNLKSLGIERARMVAITTKNKATATKTAKLIRKKLPDIKLLSRVKNKEHARILKDIGVHTFISDGIESGFIIGNFIMTSSGISPKDADESIETLKLRKELAKSLSQTTKKD